MVKHLPPSRTRWYTIAKQERNRRHDARRRAQKLWRAFYKTPAWQVIRAHQLAVQPLCERHLKRSKFVPANVVNHVVRHEGDWAKFIAGPFESLCKPCHDSDVQGEEVRGYSEDMGGDGMPTDPRHPFNR